MISKQGGLDEKMNYSVAKKLTTVVTPSYAKTHSASLEWSHKGGGLSSTETKTKYCPSVSHVKPSSYATASVWQKGVCGHIKSEPILYTHFHSFHIYMAKFSFNIASFFRDQIPEYRSRDSSPSFVYISNTIGRSSSPESVNSSLYWSFHIRCKNVTISKLRSRLRSSNLQDRM